MVNFDEQLNRKGTNSVKWDQICQTYQEEDLLPLWVADMDFKALERFSGLVKLDVMTYLPNDSLKGLNLESLSCYAESPKALHEAFGSSESLKELEISAGMESIEGLELFPSVETLIVDGYHLTDI